MPTAPFTVKKLTGLVYSDPVLKAVHKKYPFKITPHLAQIMESLDDPIGKQFIQAS